MLFWVNLYLFSICFTSIGMMVKNHKKFYAIIFLIVLTLISSLRYDIATDYPAYVEMFYNISKYDGEIYPEFTFKAIVKICNCLELDFQAMFLIYAVIISVFLLKAFLYWFDNNYKYVLLAICFFELSIIYGFWSSMNIIRQFAAASIAFYGLRYAYERCFWRFLIWTLVAFLFHFGAVIILPAYFVKNIKLKKSFYVMCAALSFILSKFGIESILYSLLQFIGRGSDYAEKIASNDGSGLGVLYLIGMFIFSILFINLNDAKIRFTFNMFFMGFCIHVILSNAPTMHRLAQYFFMFWYIVIPFILINSFKASAFIRWFCVIWFLLIHFGLNLYVMQLGYFSKNHLITGVNNSVSVDYNINTKFFR